MTTIPSNSESTIRTPFPMSGERIKGGEKRMASEWEELEKLSKEELIIELVRMRNLYGILREDRDKDNPLIPYMERKHTGEGENYVDGEETTDEGVLLMTAVPVYADDIVSLDVLLTHTPGKLTIGCSHSQVSYSFMSLPNNTLLIVCPYIAITTSQLCDVLTYLQHSLQLTFHCYDC